MYDSKETLELRVVIMCNFFDGVRSLYIFVFLLLQELCTFPRVKSICKERFNLDLSK